ncbi:MAG TPA: HlyD family secretion protein [Stellaceae bacterium]|nr:HlyD family secretion protein [Stellaceae bacterium]
MTSVDNEAPPTVGALRTAVDSPAARVRAHRSWRQRVRLPLMILGPLLVLLVAAYWYLTSGRFVSTEDAYVETGRVAISNDVSGRVVAIEVHDNQYVEKGQVLFRIDPRPFRIAVEQAKANLAGARLQIEALKATYQQKLADTQAQAATVAYDQTQLQRQQRLLAAGAASQQQFDQARHDYQVARQQLASDQQALANVLASLGGDPNIPVDRHPTVEAAQAALDRALLNLSYTVVRAPQSGIVTKVEQLQVGDYVQGVDTGAPPTPLFSLVPTKHIWVTANFKETELTHMRPGEKATIEIDTYPGAVFTGRVESLSPGTGLTFALLPAENATGNWVKVVQRLPVRISIDNPDPGAPLHAGLSATVEVDTGYRRPWLDRVEHLFAWLGFSDTSSAAER